jgi:hypothetical protein
MPDLFGLLAALFFAVMLFPSLNGNAAAPVNDALGNATLLSGSVVITNASNVGATKQPGEPMHAGDAGGKSVWWSWMAPFTGSVIIHTTGSSFDTLLAVYAGDTLATLTLVAANDQDLLDPLGGDTSRVAFDAQAGTRYGIMVDGWNGEFGGIILSLDLAPPPPRLSQPRFLADGAIQVTLFGAAGRTYVMEARNSLTSGNWTPLATNTASPTGVWTIVDPVTLPATSRFYRARLRE